MASFDEMADGAVLAFRTAEALLLPARVPRNAQNDLVRLGIVRRFHVLPHLIRRDNLLALRLILLRARVNVALTLVAAHGRAILLLLRLRPQEPGARPRARLEHGFLGDVEEHVVDRTSLGKGDSDFASHLTGRIHVGFDLAPHVSVFHELQGFADRITMVFPLPDDRATGPALLGRVLGRRGLALRLTGFLGSQMALFDTGELFSRGFRGPGEGLRGFLLRNAKTPSELSLIEWFSLPTRRPSGDSWNLKPA